MRAFSRSSSETETETETDLKQSDGSLTDGMRIIAEFVRTLPRKPGVYRMIAADGEVLYVGKAKSLRSRVAAYTQPTRLVTRLMRMVSATTNMEFSVTDSEWISAVPTSHGMKDAFSTGSQNHQPPQPSS